MVCVYSQSAVPLRTTPAILVKHSFKIDRFLVIHLHTPLISHLLIPLHFLYFLLFLLGCFLVCILLLTTEVLFSLTSAVLALIFGCICVLIVTLIIFFTDTGPA